MQHVRFLGMASETLCSRCCEIPFETLFFGRYSRITEELPLKPLHDVWKPRNCTFCGLVKELLGAHFGTEYMEARLAEGHYEDVILYRTPLDVSFDRFNDFTEVDVACYLEVGLDTPDHLHGKQPQIHRQDRKRNDGSSRDWVMPSIFAIQDSEQRMSRGLPGRFVDRDRVDRHLIKRWYSACLGSHDVNDKGGNTESFSSSHLNRRSYLRVIDVESACIVPCPPDAPYIALSYQWGTDQKVKLRKEYISIMTTPGFFNTAEGQPAQTIRDAMTMVQQLGYRFAWVDALCIVQDDIENVIENVDRMNQVYQGAHLTFVAAAGQNAYHGLPGVSTPQKERQLRVYIKGITISNMLESAHGAISFTRWNTRGWTYQERLLSKRLVIFTASQVFYQCDRGCGFQEQYQYTPGSDLTHTFPDPLTRLDFENQNIWEVYAIAVAEYTRRSLTDPMDKLRALSGILNCLEQPFGAPFFFGLPSTLFDVGLLWKPLGPCSRNSSVFPSWSWAGWDGAVAYELIDCMNNMCECVISQAEIKPLDEYFCICSEIASEANVSFLNFDTSKWRRRFDEEELAVEYENLDSRYSKYRYPRPLPLPNSPDYKFFSQPTSTVLNISAKVAKFWLTDEHSHMVDPLFLVKAACKQGFHELCYLAILDDQQQMAGTIIVNGALLPRLVNKKHRFLGLSRSTLYRIDEDPSWDPITHSFKHWRRQKPPLTAENVKDDPKTYTQGRLISMLADDDVEPNDRFFDRRCFSDQVFWPAVNVLLLSEEKKGVVERLGVGKIHIDAFKLVAVQEQILLG